VRLDANQRTLSFTRVVKALVQAKGDYLLASNVALGQWQSDSAVAETLKSAVNIGSSATWGGQLVTTPTMGSEFAAAVRAQSVLGRLSAARKLPFNTRIARTLTPPTATWVSAGAPIPVSEAVLDAVSLGNSKVASIVVISQELSRAADPSAEQTLQADLIDQVAAFTDVAFLSPAYAAVANKNPASITNTLTPIASTGVTALAISNDLRSAVNAILTNGGVLVAPVWIMHPRVAFALSLLRDAQNNTAFPEIALRNTIGSAPILTSTSIPSSASGGSIIVLLDAAELLLADGNDIEVDSSPATSLQMDSAPSAGAQNLVSLWQNDLVALRLIRTINWAPRRTNAAMCAYIDAVQL
jgi:HK97 family phage major capsid protein